MSHIVKDPSEITALAEVHFHSRPERHRWADSRFLVACLVVAIAVAVWA